MPFGFGQENGITEKNPTFNKILLLEGLFSGFKTIKSWSGNTDRGRKKNNQLLDRNRARGFAHRLVSQRQNVATKA